jgi:hypothetical protein
LNTVDFSYFVPAAHISVSTSRTVNTCAPNLPCRDWIAAATSSRQLRLPVRDLRAEPSRQLR